MLSTRKNYYHPFTDSFLGAFAQSNSMITNDTSMILEDIDLYFQPVPRPIVAGIFCGVLVIILILGLFLDLKILRMLKKEDSIVKNITRTFVFAHMTLLPILIITINLTNFVHNLPPMITNFICPLIWFLIHFCINLSTFHSFVTATMRYFYIVHTDKVNSIGKEKVKKIFHAMSTLIPLIVTIWKSMDGAELDPFSFINKCYGTHHKVFLVETSTLNVFTKSFCEIENFAEVEGYNFFVALVKQIFCVASMTTILIMGSNLTEGLIYYKLFSHMNR